MYIKLFLRLTLAIGFLSAIADRFGMWSQEKSAWGNWDNFLEYTQLLNPWFPDAVINPIAIAVTIAELLLAIFLIIGFKTTFVAKLSDVILLTFALAMTISTGIKAPLDYSVFTAAAAAFGLSLIKEKFFEIDTLIHTEKQ